MKAFCDIVLKEIAGVLPGISEESSKRLCREIARAKRIYITGVGRSAIMVKAFGQRLMHLGFEVHCADEITAPAIGRGDLLVVCSATGHTLLPVYMARRARRFGARVAALTARSRRFGARCAAGTARPRSRLARIAHFRVEIPAPLEPGRRTRQPARSLFEQALFLYLDAVILRIMQELKIPGSRIRRRHANLE